MKNIILSSLKETYNAIYKKKSIFFVLFMLQLLFFLALFISGMHYQVPILENSKAINDYLVEQQTNDIDLTKSIIEQKDIFGPDPLSISRNFNEIRSYFRYYIISLFLIFFIFIILSYSLANKILGKKTNSKNIAMVSFTYLFIIFLLFYFVFSFSLTELADVSDFFLKYVPMLLLCMVLFYFMFISIGISKNKLEEIVKETLYIGIRKIHYVFLVKIINFALIFLFFILTIYLAEKAPLITFLTITLMTLSFVFGKIFFIKTIEKLSND